MMAKSLVIVESPTKARTIKRYLGKGYDIEATMGHIKDLPKSSLGVDIEGGFKANYRVKPDKRNIVKKLKKIAGLATQIYLASDPDREGEAIAWHVAEEIKDKKRTIHRIIFHEITKKAIEDAIKRSKSLDENLYNAQVARRCLDRVVGYTMSPLLWKKVKSGLSGGRVQSVAVRLICLRQEEIEGFKPEEYWTVDVNLATEKDGEEFAAKVVDPKDIPNEDTALKIKEEIEKAPCIKISEINKKVRTKRSLPPFITSTMQQEASRRLRFSAKKTMVVAQQLYEGISIGDKGLTGLITYMRTDSPSVARDAITDARGFITAQIGKEYLPDSPIVYKAKKTAQEAHEAIRPTSMENTPEVIKPHLKKDQYALYELIWKRFIASQMKGAIFDQTSVEISAGDIRLRAAGSVLRFDGFLKIYKPGEEKDSLLPAGLEVGQILELLGIDPKQHFTQPPPRYTEASLIKELEDKGIGRPSTYAPIISTIQERGYVRLEGGAFSPTELGRDVNMLLVKHYPNILDINFTANMEEMLDMIEEGRKNYSEAMQAFYSTYNKEHTRAEKEMKNLRAERRPAGIICDKCGAQMLIKLGKTGHFLGCSGWPECKNTKNFTRDSAGKIIVKEPATPDTADITCDKCGAPMVMKHGKFGSFLACSNYPECKNTRPVKQKITTDKKCDKCGAPMVARNGKFGPFLACSKYPKCKNIMPYPLGFKCPIPSCTGEIVEKRTRKGKTFYSCSNKDCDFISWTRPVPKKCPTCSADFLLRKGAKLICPNPECDHEQETEDK